MTGFLLMVVGGGFLAAAIKYRAHFIVKVALVCALIAVIVMTPDGHHVTNSLVTFAQALGNTK